MTQVNAADNDDDVGDDDADELDRSLVDDRLSPAAELLTLLSLMLELVADDDDEELE